MASVPAPRERAERGPRRPWVLVDTNAWLLVGSAGLPLEAEVGRLVEHARLAVLDSTLGELDRLVRSETPGARLAQRLAQRFPTLHSPLPGDAGLLAVARARLALVVTADRRLARRLREQGTSVLVPRDRVRLELKTGGARRPGTPGALR